MRRERRGGDADAEAPQAFKEGTSTLRNAQNRTHISCSAAARGLGGGDRLSLLAEKEEGATHHRVAPGHLHKHPDQKLWCQVLYLERIKKRY